MLLYCLNFALFRLTKEQIILDWSETSEEALLEASNNPVAQDTSSNANKSALETAMGKLYKDRPCFRPNMDFKILYSNYRCLIKDMELISI